MLSKPKEKEYAIRLRKQGYSYSEILAKVPVSQASLSFWLRNVQLNSHQVEHLFAKKRSGQAKGARKRRSVRELQQELIIKNAEKQIKRLSDRELFLLGAVAYWCEGAKQKPHNISSGVMFANSDPFLIKLFLKWLEKACNISQNEIKYILCIHESGNEKKAIEYWSKIMNIQPSDFLRTSFKRHKTLTNRKNVGENYYGLMRIEVRKSTILNRKIAGWISGMNLNLDRI